MTSYRIIPLAVLSFYCLVKADSSFTSGKQNVYSPVIGSICDGSTEKKKCTKCLNEIINKEVVALEEISIGVTDNLRLCMKLASQTFDNFRCELLNKQSYTFEDYLDAACVKTLQKATPYLDLNVDLSKTQSNLGYFDLSQVTVTTLVGILKFANDSKNITSGKSSKSGHKKMCSMIKHSNYLSSLSQANGESWELDFGQRAPLFFSFINEYVCNGNKTCLDCLDSILNVETIVPKETSEEIFLKLLRCKPFVPNNVSNYLLSIKEEKYNLKSQISEVCIKYLDDQVSHFKFDKNLNISDLAKNTFYIQELVKFGIGTVFYYLHETKGLLPEAMRSGICKTVILQYTRTVKYAMESFFKYHESDEDQALQSKSPYKKLFERICGESDKYCRACHEKVGYSVNMKYPREISDAVIKVFRHCQVHQNEDFKQFSSALKETSFKSCIRDDSNYNMLFNRYPINNEANIRTTPNQPNFTNYRKFLDFGYVGICYYYKDNYEYQTNNPVKRERYKYYDTSKLASKLRESGLPGAYLFVMPELNQRSVIQLDCGEIEQ